MKKLSTKYLFLFPIVLTMIVSISHVVTWYDIANPLNWAIFMSLSVEIGALASLVAATKKIRGGVWLIFGLVTFIQMIGNIFFSFNEIDENGTLFKSWVELTSPVWEMIGSDSTDIPAMKRWLSFLEGGLLPIISLTSLHFFVKYEEPVKEEELTPTTPQVPDNLPSSDDQVIDDVNVEQLTDLQDEAKKVWKKVNELKEEGLLSEPTEEEIVDEPSALAFTPYEVEIEWDGVEKLENEETENVDIVNTEYVKIEREPLNISEEKTWESEVEDEQVQKPKRLVYTKKDA